MLPSEIYLRRIRADIQPRNEKWRVLAVYTRAFVIVFVAVTSAVTVAQQTPLPGQSTALTIYNDNFAVARTTVDLNLQPGLNDVTTTQVTTQLEPDSVVLRSQLN